MADQGQEKMLTQWGSMRDDPHWLSTAEIGQLVRPNSLN